MNPFFCTINEQNKLLLTKPVEKDIVYFSEIDAWYTTDAFRNFSLKVVLEKNIYFKVGKTEHNVPAGSCLVAVKQPDVKAYSSGRVKSLCIDIAPTTIAEVFTIVSAKEQYDFDAYLNGYFSFPSFFDTCTSVAKSTFADQINALILQLHRNEIPELNKEWFFELVEKIIYQEYGNFMALNGLASVRVGTRKEALRRLYIARTFMDDNFLNIVEIKEVALACYMSEFHFFRCFKQAFGISPYQYLMNLRLNHAKELMQKTDMTLTHIGGICRFPDMPTFSKAFKRRFGSAPYFFQQSLKGQSLVLPDLDLINP